MNAVILAGGKGERLGKLTQYAPKPMVCIGGKPLLEHQIILLKKYGITDITIITHYLAEVIEDYFGNGSKLGVNISYFREPVPLGTTGGIKELGLTEDVLVLYGDVMLDMNIHKLMKFHEEKKASCTLVVHPNDHPADSDLIEADDDCRITAFHPKPHRRGEWLANLANACVYILSPSVIEHIPKGIKADFGRDIFQKIVSEERMFAYRTAEYIKDVGTPQWLAQVNDDCLKGKISRLNSENPRRAIFLDRDGVLCKEKDHICKSAQLELLPGVGEAVKEINRSEYLAIAITNQPVVSFGHCTLDELQAIHNKLETLLGEEHAKLDGIYFCPHHPEKGHPGENPKLKVECECRKPKPGMILQAAKDFNIDLKNSVMIGDSWRDVEAGKSAGTSTIWIKTGNELKDALPDRVCDNLLSAVQLVLKE